jgi:predicted nucleotidyltransferase component of viral defense system
MEVIGEAGPIYGIANLRLQGGTALAAYHLYHRESEDLDFFADAPLDARDWGKFVQQRAAAQSIQLVPEGVPNMGIARYMATSPNAPEQRVKIDLVQESPYRLAPLEKTEEGIWIGSYRDLCVGKLSAICGRFAERDFIDLHVILNPDEHELSSEDEVAERFTDLLTDALDCDPGIGPQYVGLRISKGEEKPIVSQFPMRMIRRINEEDVQRTIRICMAECARRADETL